MTNRIDKEIDEIEKDFNDKIKTVYQVVGTITTVMFIGIGWLWNNNARLQGQIDVANSSYTEVKVQLASIQSDLAWIKDYMKKNDSSFTEFNTISKN